MSGPSVYERVGGQAFFDGLAARFYEGVDADPVLRPLYPDDLAAPTRWLALFLGQYWGGPGTYSDERGHPRLRGRHLPFAIGSDERNRWYGHMRAAVEASGAGQGEQTELLAYFESAADFMVNRPG